MARSRATVLVVVAFCVTARGADPLAGTWVLNLADSRIQIGLRATIERRGNAFRYLSGGIEYSALFDEDDYPIRGLSSPATVSLKRVDDRTIQRTYKRGGKPVHTAQMQVSADGRFLTIRARRLDDRIQAKAGDTVSIYERISKVPQSDPFAGEWERNPMRSLGNSLSAVTFDCDDEGWVMFSGNNVAFRAKPNSAHYPVSGTTLADTIAINRLDSRTTQEVWMQRGIVVTTIRRTVSPDGKRMSASSSGTTPQGGHFENVYAYEKH